VIIFQGCFENIKTEQTWTGNLHAKMFWYEVELTKRRKELSLLFQKGGFICILLCERFVDGYEGADWSSTDLTKILLNIQSFYRENYPSRLATIRCHRGEFRHFLDLYGAAWSYFYSHNESLGLIPIATCNDQMTGMIIGENRFFIPVLLPESKPDRIFEFFYLLAEAIVSTRNKLALEIPEWASGFVFAEEEALSSEKSEAVSRIDQIDTKLDVFQKYKKILVHGDELLVDAVTYVLGEGFGLKVKRLDEYREDLQILNESGAPLVFCEIKGVNRGVTREYVNQADTHRERAELPPSFPTVLIINTHIKKSRNLEEKDQDVAIDQVQHAEKNNVLIIRTLDLLRLLRLRLEGGLTKEMALQLFSSGGGWLKVDADKWELKRG